MKRWWGTQVRSTALREAEFVCPRCGVDRDGSVVELQRWFFLGGLPVVPLATLPEMVECGTCGHRSDLGVLDVPTSDLLAEFLYDATRHSVISMVRASEAEQNPTVRHLALATMRAAGHAYDEVLLDHDLQHLTDDATTDRLRRLVEEMTPHGKQSFLHRMAMVAMADGVMTTREQHVLVNIGVALGMATPHINGVLAVASTHLEVG
jgi:hypothetical protein